MSYDVVTLGETMLRLTPPGMMRFEQTRTLEVHAGGSESNTAVGLARLGAKVAWLSRLTDNPFGRMIASELAAQAVDVSHVVWTDEDRVGTYYLERGKAPRGSRVIYDRKFSAASRFAPDELPLNLFEPGRAKLFHTTGISIGISKESAVTVYQAARLAKTANWLVSFDLNYRSKLWTPTEARAECESLMKLADLIFLPRRDANSIFGIESQQPSEILEQLAGTFPQGTIVLTLGAQGAVARTSAGQTFSQPAFPADEVERLGGGDAFSAGFLYRYLVARDVASALAWGAATAALKYSIPGELPLVRKDEVETLLQSSGSATVSR